MKSLHSILHQFKSRPDETTDYGVSCPLVSKTLQKSCGDGRVVKQ